MIANFLCLAGIKGDTAVDFLRKRLDEVCRFMSEKTMTFIPSRRAKQAKGFPKIWRDNIYFIKKELTDEYGIVIRSFMTYRITYALQLKNPEIDMKINTIIENISTDDFHSKIADGYGILTAGEKHYFGMGWDPKYPGWFDVLKYMETGNVPRLLFFAQYISKYPPALKTTWFNDLLGILEAYGTDNGTYIFPADGLRIDGLCRNGQSYFVRRKQEEEELA